MCLMMQEGPGSWWPLDAEVIMEDGRILATKTRILSNREDVAITVVHWLKKRGIQVCWAKRGVDLGIDVGMGAVRAAKKHGARGREAATVASRA